MEGHAASKLLVGHDSHRVQVRPGSDRVSEGPLRRHVGGGPSHHTHRRRKSTKTGALARLGDPKVSDLHPPVRSYHDVLGLEIAVHNMHRLDRRKAKEQPLQYTGELGQRKRANPRSQRAAWQMLHCDERRPVFLEVLVNSDECWGGSPKRPAATHA